MDGPDLQYPPQRRNSLRRALQQLTLAHSPPPRCHPKSRGFARQRLLPRGKNSTPSFLVLNGEEPATFSDNAEVKVITIALHLKGQRNVEKTFNKMLELGRSISDAWDMKLCDESFNTISEQRISEYKNEAHEVDLKNGSYGG